MNIVSKLALTSVFALSASAALANGGPLLSCTQTDTDGTLILNVSETAEGLTQAQLLSTRATGPEIARVLAELSHCTRSPSRPEVVQSCNNVEWNDRWNVEFFSGIAADGTEGIVAVLNHNDTDEVTLRCSVSPSELEGQDAIRVEGAVATTLINAFLDAGLTKSLISGGFRLEAEQVRCEYTPQGFLWAQCEAFDGVDDTQKSAITGKARALHKALTAAGAPSTPLEGMEGDEVQVSRVECTSGGFLAGASCRIFR